MKAQNMKELDNMKTITQRFQLITVAKYRDKDKIRRVSQEIDRIREKTKGKGDGTTTAEIIRKWRDTRYGPSRD